MLLRLGGCGDSLAFGKVVLIRHANLDSLFHHLNPREAHAVGRDRYLANGVTAVEAFEGIIPVRAIRLL
jgi:hypothetical protein